MRWSGLSPAVRAGSVALLLLLLAFGIVPLVQTAYRRQDELRRAMHQAASTATLPWLAAVSAAGVLQAAGLVATFSQFWTLGAIVCLWGFRLMLADCRYQ